MSSTKREGRRREVVGGGEVLKEVPKKRRKKKGKKKGDREANVDSWLSRTHPSIVRVFFSCWAYGPCSTRRVEM